jgi:hypothetical protein
MGREAAHVEVLANRESRVRVVRTGALGIVSACPAERSSRMTTRCPAAIRAFALTAPMYPAPPVIKTERGSTVMP